jgi:hypothetical protein
MKPNVASRLGTDTPLINDLIAGIRKGEIKVPQFQRKFVWKEEQALRLLDSIGSNYPVGSLLLWRTRSKLATERNIGDFQLPETDDHSPTDYVLDGQQRLTVIYSCLGAEEGAPGFQVAYDLENEVFTQRPNEHLPHVFPLRILYDTTKLLNFRSGLVSHPEGIELQGRLDQVIHVLMGYRIPVVTLKDLSVEEVCPIFERINSSGTKLSTYDLMVAATWSDAFDLNVETSSISSSLERKGFGDIEGDTILKCLSAIRHNGIKKEQVLSLRNVNRNEMDALVEKAKEALLKTVDLLTTEFRIHSWDFLPYEAYAIVLAYVFAKRENLGAEDVARVRRWFWSSAFSERYRGASEHFISRDLEEIDEYIVGGAANASFGSPPSADELVRLSFRANNSRSRAFVLLLALKAPRNLTNGAAIDPAEALSAYNRKQFHHIYPKAHLARSGEDAKQNSLMNICMLAASENNWISDQNPSQYLPDLGSKLGQDADLVLRSNLMPDLTTVNYQALGFDDFLKKRSEIVHPIIVDLCNGKSV